MCKVRQVASTIEGIRRDHVVRYQLAAATARKYDCRCATDLGCGVGYGAWLMARRGISVLAVDRDEETVNFAKEHYSSPLVTYVLADIKDTEKAFHYQRSLPNSLLVAFEVIEHSRDAPSVLKVLSASHKILVGSVPNEEVVPYTKGRVNPEHYRHYTPKQLSEELADCGWRVTALGSQMGKRDSLADIDFSTSQGRTLVFIAKSL